MNRCAICGRKLKNSETTCGLEFCKACERYEQRLADKEVKIEVLERDIENLHRTLEEANEEFAEKDKEIEELKADKNKIICHIGYDNLKFLMETNDWKICDNTQFDNFVKQLRHQVCEEIKEKFCIEDVKQRFENSMCDGCIKIPYKTLLKILNEIEYAKESIDGDRN